MKLFLDDQRSPMQCVGYMYNRIGSDNLLYAEEWRIVRTYSSFKEVVTTLAGKITHISFDFDIHDTDERGNTVTGMDCAALMKEIYDTQSLTYPAIFVHSNNEKGIKSILELFRKA